MKSCPKCKAKVRDIDKFCHECGCNVKKDILMWLFTILIIISLATVGFVLYHAFFNPSIFTNSVNPIINSVVADTNCKKCNEFEYKCTGNDKSVCENIDSKENPCYKWIEYKDYGKCNEKENYCADYNTWYNCENIGNNCYDWVIYSNNDKCATKTTSDSDCNKCQEYDNKCVDNDYYHCENIGNNCYDWVIYQNNYNCCKKCQEYDFNCVGNDYYHCENIGDNCYDWVIYPNSWTCKEKGILYITSSPSWAKFKAESSNLDYSSLIIPPYKYVLQPGNYYLLITKKGYESMYKEIVITKGETTKVNAVLTEETNYNNPPAVVIDSFGTLDIKSYPDGATLYLNDEEIGKAPYINYNVPVGIYNVKIVKAGYGDYCTKAYIFKGKIDKITALLSTKSIGCD